MMFKKLALLCVLLLLCFAFGCERFPSRSGSSTSATTAALETRINQLQAQLEKLHSTINGDTAGHNGRYQFVTLQNARANVLVDTKLGLAWSLTQDNKTRKETFVPILFKGGYSVPALENDSGELLDPEREIQSLRSLAEAHLVARQVHAQNAQLNAQFGGEGDLREAVLEPRRETARASLVRPKAAAAVRPVQIHQSVESPVTTR